jgi:hypothetical protein
VEYELTRDSIYRAESAGMDINQILTFLESVSTVDIPQNVRRTLEEWGGQLERITIRQRAPLLHVADAALLDQLYANPKMAPLLGRRLAPTAALVASANLESLRQQLIASGQLPALTEGPEDPSATGPHLSVNADGEIAFHRHLPSIFDLSLLRPFTEDKHGVLRLTPGSLRRAARAGQSADTILTTLKQLGGEPANADVAAFVRRWAKDWGRGALFQTAILQVDNPNTRADLLADPALKPYLQAIPDAPTLALVRPKGIDKVRALLDERGMSLEDRLLR